MKCPLYLAVLSSITILVQAHASEKEYIDQNIPESWYEAPKTASELGIEEFNESPMLAERVAKGELPPVEERLPDNPPVIEPYAKTGQYGGTANLWGTSLPGGNARFLNDITGAKKAPDGKQVPFLIKNWKYSDDYKELTIYLRKGCKWSDGVPFTTEEYRYLWEYVLNNKKLFPVPPDEQSPALVDLTIQDKWTATFHFKKPTPWAYYYLVFGMTPLSEGKNIFPAHFMKKYHPEHPDTDSEKVKNRAEKEGVEWQENYSLMQQSDTHPDYDAMRPTIKPYIAVKRSVSSLVLERNPYYPFVDTQGNQLPYIDRLRVDLANNAKMAASKAATGEAAFAARNLYTAGIPLYKKYGRKSGYRTMIYRMGGTFAITFNLTHRDTEMRKIFNDLTFRKAMSLAINRDDINRKLYFNKAAPMQATVSNVDPMYKERYGEVYADYAPDKARQLLDKMGLKDRNGDGFREMPDGEKFNPQFIYTKMAVDPTSILEMVTSDWRDVGVKVDLKMLNRGLWSSRCRANRMDITQSGTADGPARINTPYGLNHLAPVSIASSSPWTQWALWRESGGKEGMEPPPKGKELIRNAETLLTSADPQLRQQARRSIIKSQAENLWKIGVVGLRPQPIIVSENLRNVAERGLWWWAFGKYLGPYHTEQFYLKTNP